MKLKKYKILFTIILINLLITLTIFAKETNDIQYKFTQTDSSYTFSGSFKIKANPNCILDLFFYHEHIRALAPDAKEVLLMDQGGDWNQISYTYQKYIWFVNKSVWHRNLNKEKQRVDFTLVSSENNQSIMPRMISSSGFYKLKKQEKYIIVEYYQQCQLTKSPITNLYLNRAKKEAIQFMHRFLEYANTICSDSLSNN
jgi:hypothetical protein